MQKIFLRNSKSLIKMNCVTLFEGEQNVDYLNIIIPQIYNNTDLTKCNIRMHYTTSDGNEYNFLIDEYKQTNLYKGQISYLINIDSRFTYVSGEINMYLVITKSDNNKDIVLKTDSETIYIRQHPSGIPSEIPEQDLQIIDQVVIISNKALDEVTDLKQRADSGEFKGEKGDKGDNYIMTEDDYNKIVQNVLNDIDEKIFVPIYDAQDKAIKYIKAFTI